MTEAKWSPSSVAQLTREWQRLRFEGREELSARLDPVLGIVAVGVLGVLLVVGALIEGRSWAALGAVILVGCLAVPLHRIANLGVYVNIDAVRIVNPWASTTVPWHDCEFELRQLGHDGPGFNRYAAVCVLVGDRAIEVVALRRPDRYAPYDVRKPRLEALEEAVKILSSLKASLT
jgi:hypothetical protein